MSPSATSNGTTNGATNGAHSVLDWHSFCNVIDGKLTTTEKTRTGINPATSEPNDPVPVSTPEDVDRAVAAAEKAFPSWADTPYGERRKAVNAFADALEGEKENFAKLLVKEQGKPLHFARFEIDFTLQIMRTVTSFDLPTEEIVNEPDRRVLVRYVPLGPTVGIVPWNYPILLACGKIAPALLTGNTIIIKPSPFTPCGDLKLCELGQRFFPPGVLQCLSGDDNLGPWMTAHPGPRKISFTGSSATGKKVMASASATLKRVTLELGGNDPAIVLDDVDVEQVAPKIATLAFLNSGQICLALKRIFVQEGIYDKFRDAMVRYTQTLKMGEGNEDGVFLGPIQNSMQYERVKGFFAEIEQQEQKVAVGGKNPDGKGYFITPTILENPKDESRIVTEEPFGPIVPLLQFTTEEEAVARANKTNLGLGASVWSGNVERANKLAAKLEAGNVWVNTHFELDPRAPFGGHKESGIGLEFGMGGLKGWCNSQTLYLRK
ncbi:uncharacterized protein HMPREF1541_01476 [Cyphellophora europaea CBS 101466]|uniref:aldehyde dehydrogenase (NAD(+)) n=1 Tax=Cyphellophora europaea (strain CBS 101466) TaxID=1220924 RepID=W2S0X1_CYPE1|nr:uncharacterized protein HMPREF1541_01476 [Cyphellophora europaea CBS 101466]ETN42322.1 hypothetical protein HMPREF1541_01476 [Cyphellophora europaea CBS 101466]